MASDRSESPPSIAIALLSLVLLAIFVAPASGAQTHLYTGTAFGPDGVGGTANFQSVAGLAVDPANQNIYVLDGVAGKIYKFDPAGHPLSFSALSGSVIEEVGGGGSLAEEQIAVAPPGAPGGTAGDIYVANNESGSLQVYAPSGAKLAALETPGETCGVAVNSAGHLFVGVYSETILEYTPKSNPPLATSQTGSGIAEVGLCNVAAANAGTIYVANFGGDLYRLESLADTSASLFDPASTMAVNLASGDLYADRGAEVVQYNQAGVEVGRFGAGSISGSRALAIKSGGSVYVGTAAKVKLFGPAVLVPDVEVAPATDITAGTATLHGSVSAAGGPDATCQFEYVIRANFEDNGFNGAEVVPCEPAGPFSGSGSHSVSARIAGLSPGSEYRYRLLGTNANGSYGSATELLLTALSSSPSPSSSGPCPANEAFRTGFGASLPDCRAYELASPAEKRGNATQGFAGFLRASSDSSAVTFYNQGGTTIPAPRGGTQSFSTFLATRNSDFWETQRLLPPQEYGPEADWLGSTPDLRFAIVEAAAGEGVPGRGLFEIDTTDGAITTAVPLDRNIEPEPFQRGNRYAYDGASEDGSRIYFETRAHLVPEAAEGVDNLYVWSRETGSVSLAGVLPETISEAPSAGSFGGAYEWFLEQNTLSGGALGGLGVESAHAVSPTGDQIYFTAGGTGQLYLRRGVNSASPETVQVSKPNPGLIGSPTEAPAAFQEATPDGSRAFFVSSERLTEDATTGPAEGGKDLYRWDAATQLLVDIAPDVEDPNGAEVKGLVGISSDGSSGYFVAKGVLAAGASAGRENLYRFHEITPESFKIGFVTTLYSGPRTENNVDGRLTSPREYNLEQSPAGSAGFWKTARTSSSGNVLVFTSVRSITGYRNTSSACTGIGSDEPCAQIYTYSAVTNKIDCISCDPTGAPPLGSARLQNNLVNAAKEPKVPPSTYVPRNLSADGTRVFFASPDPLVANDTNGNSGCPYYNATQGEGPECQDVYEWEAPNAPGGSCQAPEVNGGCVYLLSSGQSDTASFFVDASADGSDAFIITESQLVPSDKDSANDVYDVRVGGGLVSQHSVAANPCEGEACLATGTAPPSPASPGSSQIYGPKNPKHKKHKHKKHKHKKHKHKKHKHKKQSRTKRTAGSSQGGRS